MGKRFRKGGKTASTSGRDVGTGSLSEEELKALEDETSFCLENIKDFHEVKDLAQLLHRKLFVIFQHDTSCAVFHDRLSGWSNVKGEDERDVFNHCCQEQGN